MPLSFFNIDTTLKLQLFIFKLLMIFKNRYNKNVYNLKNIIIIKIINNNTEN